jgi:hypothetical protein
MLRIQSLIILALATTTSASAFLPGAAVKNSAVNVGQQNGARFPLANK